MLKDILKHIGTYIPKIVFASDVAYIKIGTILIHFGTTVFAVSAAKQSTENPVKFLRPYTSNPIVVVGLGGAPGVDTLIVSAKTISLTNFVGAIYASNTTSRRIYWIAIGRDTTSAW